jgi:hypothetical protein
MKHNESFDIEIITFDENGVPSIPFEHTIEDCMEYWQKRISLETCIPKHMLEIEGENKN